MRTRELTVFACVLCAGSVCAQSLKQNALPFFDSKTTGAHEIKPLRHSFPLSGVPANVDNVIILTLTVSRSGDVIDAKARGVSDYMQFWPQIEGEILGWKFTPFEKNGKPVKAQVEEAVELVPPERLPTTHVTPPNVRADSRIVFTLTRTVCLGACPDYTVTVTNTSVVFKGLGVVEPTDQQLGKVDPAAARKLAEKFVASDFYSMDPEYDAKVFDAQTYTLSIQIDGRRKVLRECEGALVGMPAVITELENDVDDLAQTQQWIKGK